MVGDRVTSGQSSGKGGLAVVDFVDKWWVEVEEASQLLTSFLGAMAARASSDGTYTPLPGSVVTRRRPGSLRHIDEVIRLNRWYTGADKDMIGGLFAGKLVYLTNPSLVVAVARACHVITGEELTVDDTHALVAASHRIQVLVAEARAADERLGRAALVVRAHADLVDPNALPSSSTENDGENTVIESRAVFTRRLSRDPHEDSRQRWRWRITAAAAASTAVIVLGTAGFVSDVLPWPWGSTDDFPEYRVPVVRPTAQELERGRNQCAKRVTVVDNGNHQASGSVRLNECADTIEFAIADLDRDARCVYIEIIWSAQTKEKSDDACPVGHIVHQQLPKRTKDFTIELVSIYRP
ncbi:MAG: hypothetical protein ACRDTC_28400 [Pseudonocardiaceae bacterium]